MSGCLTRIASEKLAVGGKSLLAAAAVAMIGACASVNTPDQSLAGQIASTDVPASAFKLGGYNARWIAVENLGIEMRCSYVPYTLSMWCPKDEAMMVRARQDVARMSQLLEENAVDQLDKQLARRGFVQGTASSIELEPQRAYWSAGGWGSGILVKVLVTNTASGRKWSMVVPADTGIQMLGAMLAGPLTVDYAAAFASRLDRVFESAGFFK